MNWDLYPNFTEEEFKCSHTGKCEMRPEFMELLQGIRTEFRRPMIIGSGFRHITHPIEAAKESGGAHSLGLACDPQVRGEDALDLLRICLNRGIKRVGVYQNKDNHFLHIDIADRYGFPISIWSK